MKDFWKRFTTPPNITGRIILPDEMTPEWTEGVCSDGAAILRDGQPVTISEILERLNRADRARLEALEEAAKIAGDYDTGGVSREDHLACSIAAAIRERAKT